MPTITTGLFFVGKDRPTQPAVSTHKDDTGTFVLKLRVVDNQGPRRVESYVVRWTGAEAQAWHAEHGALPAGTPLALELVNPRSIPGQFAPETHAQVQACRLMPTRSQTKATA